MRFVTERECEMCDSSWGSRGSRKDAVCAGGVSCWAGVGFGEIDGVLRVKPGRFGTGRRRGGGERGWWRWWLSSSIVL